MSSDSPPEPPPPFPDHCPDHAHTEVPPRCGGCQKTKEANRRKGTHLALVAPITQQCLVHMEPDVAHCRGCAADRKAATS